MLGTNIRDTFKSIVENVVEKHIEQFLRMRFDKESLADGVLALWLMFKVRGEFVSYMHYQCSWNKCSVGKIAVEKEKVLEELIHFLNNVSKNIFRDSYSDEIHAGER